MTDPNDPADPTRVWSAMRALVLDNDRRREVCDALGMSFFRVKALRRIAASPIKLGDLAADLMTDRPYTTLVVDDLARRGLVERTPHPTDRRSKIVTATPAGAAAAEEAERILGTPPTALRELDEADLAVLQRVMTKLEP
ncbi:MarR family winged helix-turn-helix transcriptional regulator [Streptomyces sp. NBC_01262]|uniref:MarR family winged helix-turn-helix transcriptional regulator n=1 Tax=Streptomyces sp. NBC_01262 TaxID=2903803 RepID=UPI002E30233F|nr:MarR family transcriptional regulator [Streptomyces sp. NBC_01262]